MEWKSVKTGELTPITLLFCCCFLALPTFAGIQTNELQEMVHNWRWDVKSLDASSLTAEQRSWMISELRNYGDRSDVVEEKRTRRMLIELGDRETADKVIAEYLAEDASPKQIIAAQDVLEFVTLPWVIPMLAQGLQREELLTEQVWEYRDPALPRSAGSAFIITQIVKRSRSFSDDVRRSAELTGNVPFMDLLRESVRQWWQQNKEHFEKQDYAAVTPLKPVTDSTPKVQSGQSQPVSTSVASETNIVATAKSSALVAAAPSTPAQPRFNSKLVGVMAFVALAATGLLVFLRSRNS